MGGTRTTTGTATKPTNSTGVVLVAKSSLVIGIRYGVHSKSEIAIREKRSFKVILDILGYSNWLDAQWIKVDLLEQRDWIFHIDHHAKTRDRMHLATYSTATWHLLTVSVLPLRHCHSLALESVVLATFVSLHDKVPVQQQVR